jgi:glycosyltransferase involved in cell wall biosynthesis
LVRLQDPRFQTCIITDESEGASWLPGVGSKIVRILGVVGRARLARPEGVLLARWSPFIAWISRRWRRRGLPSLVFVQGNLDDLYDSNPWTRRVPWITTVALESIRDASHVVTPSEGLAEWVSTIRRDGRASVTVIPNGADVELFDRERRSVDAESVTPHALFFGNMAQWQGIDTVLAALEDPRWPEDLELWIIGDGQMAEAVRQCGDQRVRYLGRQPKARVARAAAEAEITLATRHADGASATGVSPFKIIESAAAGTPCIVTRVPGQTELAQDIGGSLLIPADDPSALAEAVARLHGDPVLRGRLAEEAVRGVSRYDWAASGPALTSIVLAVAGIEASPDPGMDQALNQHLPLA